MGDAGFFKGTSAEQDSRFGDKQKKLLKSMKFPKIFDKKVDIKKVNLAVIRPWVTQKVISLVGFEDDVLIEFVFNLLEAEKLDPRTMQIEISGFLESNAPVFMTDLWGLLVSAQTSIGGIPQLFLDQKKEEILKKRKEDEQIKLQLEEQKKKEMLEREEREATRKSQQRAAPSISAGPDRKSRMDSGRDDDRRRRSRSRSVDYDRSRRFDSRRDTEDRDVHRERAYRYESDYRRDDRRTDRRHSDDRHRDDDLYRRGGDERDDRRRRRYEDPDDYRQRPRGDRYDDEPRHRERSDDRRYSRDDGRNGSRRSERDAYPDKMTSSTSHVIATRGSNGRSPSPKREREARKGGASSNGRRDRSDHEPRGRRRSPSVGSRSGGDDGDTSDSGSYTGSSSSGSRSGSYSGSESGSDYSRSPSRERGNRESPRKPVTASSGRDSSSRNQHHNGKDDGKHRHSHHHQHHHRKHKDEKAGNSVDSTAIAAGTKRIREDDTEEGVRNSKRADESGLAKVNDGDRKAQQPVSPQK
ncbi:hypothetical protein DFJ77DRAFT_531323 [Powellomyces hirtus]|nr:hypothetical protein DFJ77DRAFT_531323 [Powellomyces hirtus]